MSGEGEWIKVKVINSLPSDTLSIKDASLSHGGFYKDGNGDVQIPPEEVNRIRIPSTGSAYIYSHGPKDYSSGTTGEFSVYHGETKIAHVHWACPWDGAFNDFGADWENTHYWVQHTPWKRKDGAIGLVEVEVGLK